MKGEVHLDDNALAALALGERKSSMREKRHLESCGDCRRALESTRRLADALRFEPSRPGVRTLADAAGLLRERQRARELPARLVATLRPGMTSAAPAGLRSAAPATRQWLFRAGELEIDLQAFAEGPEQRRILGQVMGTQGAAEGLPVHLRHDGPSRMVVTDACGEFSVGPVRGAAVRLLVESDDELVRLDLGPLPAPDEDEE